MAVTTSDLEALSILHGILEELRQDLSVRGSFRRSWQITDEKAHIEHLQRAWAGGLQEEQLPLAV